MVSRDIKKLYGVSGILYMWIWVLVTSIYTFGTWAFYYVLSFNWGMLFFIPIKKNFLETLRISLNTACFTPVKTTKPLIKKQIFSGLLSTCLPLMAPLPQPTPTSAISPTEQAQGQGRLRWTFSASTSSRVLLPPNQK